jgi:hypothetical protein
MSALVLDRESTRCAVSRTEVTRALATRRAIPVNVAESAVVAVYGSGSTIAVVASSPSAGLDVTVAAVEAHARLFPGLLP